jgi:hypothetical protein
MFSPFCAESQDFSVFCSIFFKGYNKCSRVLRDIINTLLDADVLYITENLLRSFTMRNIHLEIFRSDSFSTPLYKLVNKFICRYFCLFISQNNMRHCSRLRNTISYHFLFKPISCRHNKAFDFSLKQSYTYFATTNVICYIIQATAAYIVYSRLFLIKSTHDLIRKRKKHKIRH